MLYPSRQQGYDVVVGWRCPGKSVYQQVVASAKELDESLISQHLQLLPYLCSYMAIAGMEARQIVLKAVYIVQSEHLLIQLAHTGLNIGRPATVLV